MYHTGEEMERGPKDLNGPPTPGRNGGRGNGDEPWKYASSGDVRRTHDEYGTAVGDWIHDLASWQWFVTCTLRDPPAGGRFTIAGAGQARRCLRELLVTTRAREYVCVFELQKRGAYHLHALLSGCPAINGKVASEHFEKKFGTSRWKIFKDGGGAAKYLGKYLMKDVVELYIGSDGPWTEEDFKVLTGGFTKKLTPKFTWDTTMKGARV